MTNPYRKIMIDSFVERQVKNYIEEGWDCDRMDPDFRLAHILDPLARELSITDEERESVISFAEILLADE